MVTQMPARGVIPDRPHRPLVIKCGYEGSVRRVNFPTAATCRLESLRTRVGECFALSTSSFCLTYTDDDGEEVFVRSEADLTDAIAYFVSGDDDAAVSIISGQGGIPPPLALSAQKITIRLEVTLEYDGPSLSDASSISSFTTGFEDSESQSESSWRSSDYAESRRNLALSGSRPRRIDEEDDDLTTYEEDARPFAGLSREPVGLNTSFTELNLVPPNRSAPSTLPPASSPSSLTVAPAPHRSPASHVSTSTETPQPRTLPTLTGPESDPAPALLTHSELGSRWLREQSNWATTRRLPSSKSARSGAIKRYTSDEDSLASDEDSVGDIALVRDAKGKFYYSYQATDSISLSSTSHIDPMHQSNEAGPSRGESHNVSPAVSTPPTTPCNDYAQLSDGGLAHEPTPTSPILAPDCAACGLRLDYMRYVCKTCGEGELWRQYDPDKPGFVSRRISVHSSTSDQSERTEWAGRENRAEIHTKDQIEGYRSRSSSMSKNASPGGRSPSHYHQERPLKSELVIGRNVGKGRGRPLSPSGYELCVGCIEVCGIDHCKAEATREGRRTAELRHVFQEKMWSSEGWMDVEYSENLECTICRTALYRNRYKCVSCPRFDLCRACYQKVDEIHPAHVFLSLPDTSFPPVAELRANQELSRSGHTGEVNTRHAVRHHGVFCHNCLQDIVGPRFHCAVCPSWDLCIQCEGIAAEGNESGHAADHIMMKIPLHLATNEVEAVSRRARDRWFQQDLSTVVAAGTTHSSTLSSRASSPTNETVYAGAAQRVNGQSPLQTIAQQVRVNPEDVQDHGCRCNNCNEWILGRRYQCANCPSDPDPYNLCSICELRSYRVHDPRHVFFRFDRPVHMPVKLARPLLPLLYKGRVGEIPVGAVIDPRDPTAYLKHVLHRETLCDIHSDQVRGIWLRCAHCAAGFDICQEAEEIARHDPTHVFVVFKARVDMGVFRQVADLGATQSKPLLWDKVYLN